MIDADASSPTNKRKTLLLNNYPEHKHGMALAFWA